jgi:energy-coupling factor transporter ATP-binding protein EcfA2
MAKAFGIHRVYVEDLFGRYTYDLSPNPQLAEASRLVILYGNNGSGKTTLLRLIVNLLSHVDGKGHKKRVSEVKFSRFMIWVGHFTVEARRQNIDTEGFTAIVTDAESGLVAEANYFFEESGPNPERERHHKELLGALQKIRAGLYFLADDRRITSNVLAETTDTNELVLDDQAEWISLARHRLLHGDLSSRKRKAADKVLEDAVARVTAWATTTALSASTQGEDDVNTIYSRIIQQLATSSRRKAPSSTPAIEDLVESLREQYNRSVDFSQFGLTSPPKLDKVLASVAKAPKGARDAIAKVLGPYVDSMKARLDALQGVQKSISSFVESINAFYADKALTFDLRLGLRIRTHENQLLQPTMLSSGERQLLLLFCNTFVAKQQPSIFIIDEPELSLNVKWQRQLVRSLLAITKDSQMQFVFATHSIELLTRYQEYVVELSESPKLFVQ